MTLAEAIEELRLLTAANMPNPRRVFALEMALKRLKDEADLSPTARATVAFSLLPAAERMKVIEDYCHCCWRLRTACVCARKG